MKKRTRQDAALYKEPSSDLSDLDLSSDEEVVKGKSAAQASKRAKVSKQSAPKQSKKNASAQEETKD